MKIKQNVTMKSYPIVLLDPNDKEMLFRNLLHKELTLAMQVEKEPKLRFKGEFPYLGRSPYKNSGDANFALHPNDDFGIYPV